MISIQLAESDFHILGCFAVISQLRPHLKPAKFVEQVRYQMQEGYKLAFLEVEKQAVAVAGFRIYSCLSSGKLITNHHLNVEADRAPQDFYQK
ncbi:hypothetical protein [Nostoc sp.]|uniref:hypothetical protein n=1 Tax=Nostoc sp. TaxID=1180 RepID=UPI002FF6383A